MNGPPGRRPPAVGVPVVINGVVYDRVPVRALFTTGPRYPERSGVRVGRGSVIPEWIDAAPMRNVSIRRLRPGSGRAPPSKGSCVKSGAGSSAPVPRGLALLAVLARSPIGVPVTQAIQGSVVGGSAVARVGSSRTGRRRK